MVISEVLDPSPHKFTSSKAMSFSGGLLPRLIRSSARCEVHLPHMYDDVKNFLGGFTPNGGTPTGEIPKMFFFYVRENPSING